MNELTRRGALGALGSLLGAALVRTEVSPILRVGTCPQCNFGNIPQANFCNECGHRMRGELIRDVSKPLPEMRPFSRGLRIGDTGILTLEPYDGLRWHVPSVLCRYDLDYGNDLVPLDDLDGHVSHVFGQQHIDITLQFRGTAGPTTEAT